MEKEVSVGEDRSRDPQAQGNIVQLVGILGPSHLLSSED